MGEESEAPPKRKRRGKVSKLIRLSVVAGVAAWLFKKTRARSAPPEGLWRDGFSPGGPASGRHH